MSGTYSALRDAAPHYVRLGASPYRRPHRADPVETRVPDPVDTPPVVAVRGSAGWADTAAVHAALTRAWRALGRPITVACDPATPLGRVAVAWAVERTVCGIALACGPPDAPDVVLAFPAPHPRPTGARP